MAVFVLWGNEFYVAFFGMLGAGIGARDIDGVLVSVYYRYGRNRFSIQCEIYACVVTWEKAVSLCAVSVLSPRGRILSSA